MDSLLPNISQYKFSILFVLVFAETAGLPVPAALALLIAGGTARDTRQLGLVIVTALCAMMLGDALMFWLGRSTGWWLLGVLCKISLNAESCILRAAESFLKRGRIMLVFAKFVPGINTLSPPLAGSMNMYFGQFLGLDLAGASLYILVYCGLGWMFSDSLAALKSRYEEAGHVAGWVLALAIGLYVGYRLYLLLREGKLGTVPLVSAQEVAQRLSIGVPDDMALFDVRSHGYYSKKAARIRGSVRLEPNTISEQIASLPKEKEIILYCTCQNEGTSLRVARFLQEHGCRTSVIKGGLSAWKKGGFPMETVPAEDVVLMPTF
jgi:membrane protein DedA with SNARE-associated domain/rhodanese-related sulfurtransferase